MAVHHLRMTRRTFLIGVTTLGWLYRGVPTYAARAARLQPLRELPVPAGRLLDAAGGTLVTASGRTVRLTGVNWFGMETSDFAPHGLWQRSLGDMLDQIVASGFNMLRLPFSNQILGASSQPNGIDRRLNPELVGLSALQLLDAIVQAAGYRGLKIVLDRHRPTPSGQSALWYTDEVSETQWIQDWVSLAQRYLGNPTIIGADLHNEPHNPATWGDDNPATDWRLAAERAGNAILSTNPEWLIFVQGVQQFGDVWACWGGNLAGAGEFPVRLTAPEKLVYSPHDFGPSVSWQPWFSDPMFPSNLPSIWRERWAYLQEEGITPLWLGEFGGRSLSHDADGVWTRTLLTFLRSHGISYAYWAWNADCTDTSGLLQQDWRTVDASRLQWLAEYQDPLIHLPSPRVDEFSS